MSDYSLPSAPPRSLPVRVLHKLLPTKLYLLIRSFVMTVTTPTVYAAQHGYYKSALSRSVVGSGGDAAPWLTFPLVTFLDTKSYAGRSVLEFGSGQSSLWWAKRADSIVALETDAEWTKRVRETAPANLDVKEVPLEFATAEDFAANVKEVVGDARHDVVVVDGGDRVKALLAAPDHVTDDGIIITDDLDLFRQDPDWVHATDALRAAGFGSIDFFGLAVGTPFTRKLRCSTLFFRDGSFITR